MKRFLMIMMLCGVLLLYGCGEEGPQKNIDDSSLLHEEGLTFDKSGDVIEIREKMFIAQSNDIYLNPEDYLGKTIKYEGLFKSDYWPEEDKTYYFVVRYGPGCCSYDGEAGFEVDWDGEWPEVDDWCEVVGTLEEYESDGWHYLRLALTSLTVLEERGEEYVYQ